MTLISLIRFSLLLTLVLLAGCGSTPKKEATIPLNISSHPPLVKYALSLQGTPYRYGKDSPEEGFDCSGFVKHVYQQQGIRLPRTAKDMATSLPPISKQKLQAGDLVFFDINGKLFSHVGIYVDNDHFIHAPSQRTGHVIVSDLKNEYWQKHFTGARCPAPNHH